MFERPLLRKANEYEVDQQSALLAKTEPSDLKPALKMIDSEPESPNSACSCSTPGVKKDLAADDHVNDIAGSSDLVLRPRTPQDHISVPIAADSSSSLDSLYYPAPRLIAKSDFVQNHSHGDLTPVLQRQPIPKSTDTRADSPSSVYSRSISGVAGDTCQIDSGITEDTEELSSSSNAFRALPQQQNRLSIHALGTPLSTSSPSSLCSQAIPGMFRNHLQAIDEPSVEKAKGMGLSNVNEEARAVAAEVRGLTEDQRALRQEVAALREEYRVLKDTLLKPKTKLVV
jgi:hypothetical protein